MKTKVAGMLALALISGLLVMAQTPAPALPYSPSLDLTSMDKTVDPCVEFLSVLLRWMAEENPIPPDQTGWSVYGKLYQDNLNFLRGILEQAAANPGRATR